MSYDDLMQRAISLADVYRYTAKPNPVVGAIILKDDLIISEGAHENFGSAHAEINAINRAKKKIGIDFNSFDELYSVWDDYCDEVGVPSKQRPEKKEIKSSLLKLQEKTEYGLVLGKKVSDAAPNGTKLKPRFNFKCIED